jgi:hypothetical protein
MQRFLFRTVSQIAIHYRRSPLSAGALGRVHGGDRLPWVPADAGSGAADNFAGIDGRQWRVHVYGTPKPGLAEISRSLSLPLDVFAWRPAMGKVGLTENGLYLLRPDGYVALADAGADPARTAQRIEAVLMRTIPRVGASAPEAAVG